MEQINENLLVLGPQDPFDPSYDTFLKIGLSGTVDLNTANNRLPWQQKFINGLAALTAPGGQYSSYKFVVLNSYMPVQNDTPALDNQEFVQKFQWELQSYQVCDVLFCNFLRKSTLLSAINGFLLNASSGKVIVRCPVESVFYPQIKLISDNFQIPLVGDSDSGLSIINLMFERIPRFMELQKFNLGE